MPKLRDRHGGRGPNSVSAVQRRMQPTAPTVNHRRADADAVTPPTKLSVFESQVMIDSDQLQSGLSPDSTVQAFAAACNRDSNRLFITESWFAPFRARLLSALPASLTEPLVEALRDALYKRRPLETVVEFVEQQPMTWPEFERWRAARENELHLESARRGFFPWADVEAAASDENLQRTHMSQSEAQAPAILGLEGIAKPDMRAGARNCPACGRAASELSWIYFSSPAWTWQQLCGRAGWLVICQPCHLQVDFFLDRMN